MCAIKLCHKNNEVKWLNDEVLKIFTRGYNLCPMLVWSDELKTRKSTSFDTTCIYLSLRACYEFAMVCYVLYNGLLFFSKHYPVIHLQIGIFERHTLKLRDLVVPRKLKD